MLVVSAQWLVVSALWLDLPPVLSGVDVVQPTASALWLVLVAVLAALALAAGLFGDDVA